MFLFRLIKESIEHSAPQPLASRDLLDVLRIDIKSAVESEVTSFTGKDFLKACLNPDKDYEKYGPLADPSSTDLSTIFEEGNNPLSNGLERRQKAIDAVSAFSEDNTIILKFRENIPQKEILISKYAIDLLAALSSQESYAARVKQYSLQAAADKDFMEPLEQVHKSYIEYLKKIAATLDLFARLLPGNVYGFRELQKSLDENIVKVEKTNIRQLVEQSTFEPVPASKSKL